MTTAPPHDPADDRRAGPETYDRCLACRPVDRRRNPDRRSSRRLSRSGGSTFEPNTTSVTNDPRGCDGGLACSDHLSSGTPEPSFRQRGK